MRPSKLNANQYAAHKLGWPASRGAPHAGCYNTERACQGAGIDLHLQLHPASWPQQLTALRLPLPMPSRCAASSAGMSSRPCKRRRKAVSGAQVMSCRCTHVCKAPEQGSAAPQQGQRWPPTSRSKNSIVSSPFPPQQSRPARLAAGAAAAVAAPSPDALGSVPAPLPLLLPSHNSCSAAPPVEAPPALQEEPLPALRACLPFLCCCACCTRSVSGGGSSASGRRMMRGRLCPDTCAVCSAASCRCTAGTCCSCRRLCCWPPCSGCGSWSVPLSTLHVTPRPHSQKTCQYCNDWL